MFEPTRPAREPTVSDGVVSAPVLETVVEPVPPKLAVYAESAVVEAFGTVKMFEAKVKLAAEVMLVPLKKFTPLVT